MRELQKHLATPPRFQGNRTQSAASPPSGVRRARFAKGLGASRTPRSPDASFTTNSRDGGPRRSHTHGSLQLPHAGPRRALTLTGFSWKALEKHVLDRTRPDVWEDSTADVGSLYAQGVGSIGKLYFPSDEEQQQENARFASVRVPGTDADCVVKLLLSYWRIERPSVLLSVTGSAQDIDLEPRLEHFLKEGIFNAARSTRAWVVTGGNDTGVNELAGKALRSRDTNMRSEDAVKWTTAEIWEEASFLVRRGR